jgi:cytoskeletal protein CcmA (bactofilin family)
MNIFGRQNRTSEPEHIETVLGPSANLRGTLRSDGGVRVDGVFEGAIETAGNVVVGEGAKVVADIMAKNVTVGGAVKGNVEATGRLEILSTGIVYGDISVQSVMIDQGGQLHGLSRMRGLDHPALAAPEGHKPQPIGRGENGAVDIRLDEDPVDVTARPAAEDLEAESGVEIEAADAVEAEAYDDGHDDFELDLDGLDLDMDIEPIIPDTAPTPARGRTGRRGRRG